MQIWTYTCMMRQDVRPPWQLRWLAARPEVRPAPHESLDLSLRVLLWPSGARCSRRWI